MTNTFQARLNVALALAIPAAGFLFLSVGVSPPSNPATVASIAFVLVWLATIVAVNTEWRLAPAPAPRRLTVSTERATSVVDVSRTPVRWRWTHVLLMPLEFLAVVWSLPAVAMVVAAIVGIAFAGVLGIVRLILPS